MQTPASNPLSPPGQNPALKTPEPTATRGAFFALGVLFSMNLLNYVDRYVFNSLGTQIEKALSISHANFGWLAGAFMLVYTIVSPGVGWMGDRYNRRNLLAIGVGLWSVATVGTAFANSFWEMFFWRALLGVGEASYGIVAPALLADLFAPKVRGRYIGLFYLALPLGGALGFWIGGFVGLHLGWRYAFGIVGVPGLLAALSALLIHDPGRGASEGLRPVGVGERPKLDNYLVLFQTPSYLLNIAGLAAVTFATGAYATYAAIFYEEVRHMRANVASYWIGGMTAMAGLIGIALGTWAAETLQRSTRRAYLLWAAMASMVATPFVGVGILYPDTWTSLALVFVGMILMASVLGPCNTVVANVVPANLRAAGFAINIFLIHMLGDISSPILIGHLADWLGRPAVHASALGQFLDRLGAVPVHAQGGTCQTNLTAGMLLVVPMLALGAIFFLFGSRHLAADQERTRQLGGGAAPDELLFH